MGQLDIDDRSAQFLQCIGRTLTCRLNVFVESSSGQLRAQQSHSQSLERTTERLRIMVCGLGQGCAVPFVVPSDYLHRQR